MHFHDVCIQILLCSASVCHWSGFHLKSKRRYTLTLAYLQFLSNSKKTYSSKSSSRRKCFPFFSLFFLAHEQNVKKVRSVNHRHGKDFILVLCPIVTTPPKQDWNWSALLSNYSIHHWLLNLEVTVPLWDVNGGHGRFYLIFITHMILYRFYYNGAVLRRIFNIEMLLPFIQFSASLESTLNSCYVNQSGFHMTHTACIQSGYLTYNNNHMTMTWLGQGFALKALENTICFILQCMPTVYNLTTQTCITLQLHGSVKHKKN